MKVYKFGGASVRNADGVRNLRKIIDDEQNLFIIVSAMGKTTNALEKVFEGLQKGDKQLSLEHVESLRKYHAEISDELCREHYLSVVQNPQSKTVSYEKWEGDQSKLTSRDSLRITIDTALRMQPDGFDALMQLMEEAGCWIKRGAHVSIKPSGGERYIRLDSLGAEYSEAKLRKVLDGHHIHIPKIPRSEYNYSQVKRLIDVEAKLREGKGYMIWAERNNIDAKAQSIIFLKEHNIGSIEELENQIKLCCSDYLP